MAAKSAATKHPRRRRPSARIVAGLLAHERVRAARELDSPKGVEVEDELEDAQLAGLLRETQADRAWRNAPDGRTS